MSILGKLLDNPVQKLLAVLIALTAWMYVQSQQVVEDRARATLMWRLPTGLTTVEPLPTSVTAVVLGSRAALRRASQANMRLQVDLRDAEVGEHRFELSAVDLEAVPAGVTVQGLSPSGVQLVLDEVTTRKMKVNPILVGDPAPGYVVSGVRVEPSVVEVSGPRVVIAEQLDISTKPIDISDISGAAEIAAELDLSWGVTYAGDGLVARLKVEATDDRLMLLDRPITVLDSTGSWAVSVLDVAVELEGPAADLAATDHRKISVLVYLPEPANEARYQVGLAASGPRMEVVNVPPAVRVAGVSPSVVEVFRK